MLEFIRLHDMSAYVRPAKKSSKVVPAWIGGRIPITDLLSEALRNQLDEARTFKKQLNHELKILEPVLRTQKRLSSIPCADELLIEEVISREGRHLFVFPFEGRFVHEGLAALWSMRFVQQEPSTFSLSVNDYGFEILAPSDYAFEEKLNEVMDLDPEEVETQVSDAVNLSELTQRRFRGVAQVAGLVFQGYPSSRKTEKQLQMSTSLLHGVFEEYEPEHLLLRQAEDEVLQQQLEVPRLRKSLERMQHLKVLWNRTSRPTPFAFPLMVERMSARLTNENLMQRIQRMKRQWEKY
jgi:ATP-dependent Lhr-like helicase